MIWSYITQTFGILRLFDRIYRKLCLERFWQSFVMKFLVVGGSSEKDGNKCEENMNEKRKSSISYDENKPMLLNLVENIGSTL